MKLIAVKFSKFLFIISTLVLQRCNSCHLLGGVEGNCVSRSSLSKYVDICQDYLAEFVCVPFNDEIWQNWNNKTVNDMVYKKIIDQLAAEFKRELYLGEMPLINNGACLTSYINFMCKTNFRKCDPKTDTSSPLCEQMCQAYVDNCMIGRFNCKTDDASKILPEVRMTEKRILAQNLIVMDKTYKQKFKILYKIFK